MLLGAKESKPLVGSPRVHQYMTKFGSSLPRQEAALPLSLLKPAMAFVTDHPIATRSSCTPPHAT